MTHPRVTHGAPPGGAAVRASRGVGWRSQQPSRTPSCARPPSEHSRTRAAVGATDAGVMVCAALAGVCVYRIFAAIRKQLVTWLASGEGEGRLVMYTFLFLLNWTVGIYCLFWKLSIRVQLSYNVVLVSDVQPSESLVHIHISTLWRSFPHIGRYRTLSGGVPYATQHVLISYLFYIQECAYANTNLP